MSVICTNDIHRTHTNESGFTLIEVLVASAIIMASIGVLMQLFASGLDRTHRAGQVAHLLVAQRVIVHELEMINPAMQKQGKGIAEGMPYQWRVVPGKSMQSIYDPDGGLDRQLGLFDIQVTINAGSGKKRFFTFQLLGWKNSR